MTAIHNNTSIQNTTNNNVVAQDRERTYEALNEKLEKLRRVQNDLFSLTFCQVALTTALLAGTIIACVGAVVLWPIPPVAAVIGVVGMTAFFAWAFLNMGSCIFAGETCDLIERKITKKILPHKETILADPKYVDFKRVIAKPIDDTECMNRFFKEKGWKSRSFTPPPPLCLFAQSMLRAPFTCH